MFWSLFTFRGHFTWEPASIVCNDEQGDLFHSAGLHRNHVLATANTGEIGRGFGKNAGEWAGRVELSKKEIPGSKRSMYGYILTYSRL